MLSAAPWPSQLLSALALALAAHPRPGGMAGVTPGCTAVPLAERTRVQHCRGLRSGGEGLPFGFPIHKGQRGGGCFGKCISTGQLQPRESIQSLSIHGIIES